MAPRERRGPGAGSSPGEASGPGEEPERRASAPTLRGRRLAVACAGVALLALLVLALHTPWFGLSRLHIGGRFGDQAGYVTTARNLADTGTLESGLVYPAYVEHPEWRLYMPGAYAWLALSYELFGYGVLSTLGPSLLACALAAVAVFVAGARLYGPAGGLAGALLFLVFPANPLYAHTAMAEASFTAAGAVALAALLLLAPRWRPWALPFLIALPFLFRETGALLVLPAAALLLADGATGRRAGVALAAAAATAVLAYGLLRWQVAHGKGTFSVANWVLLGGFNYRDAVLPELGERLSLGDWARALGGNALRNLRLITGQAREAPLHLDTTGLAAALGLLGLCLGLGLRARRRHPLALGAAALLAAVLLLLLFVYDARGQKVLRTLLFALPPAFVVAGGALAGAWSRVRRRGPLVAGLAVLAAGCYATTVASARELVASDAVGDAGTRLLEDLPHDDSRMLVVHPFLVKNTLAYAVEHYPVGWAMLPQNSETFERLRERYDIGTLIIATQALQGHEAPFLFRNGPLQLVREVEIDGVPYVVYQAP